MSLNDDDFIRAFEDLTLQSGDFNHRGHLRIAWLYLQRWPLKSAIDKTTTGIAAFASSLGAKDKFHCTMTQATVLIMAERIHQQKQGQFEVFLAYNPDLVDDLAALLAKHYSHSVLYSHRAKTLFIAPDRLPLPNLMSL